jgi:hypothetical protein
VPSVKPQNVREEISISTTSTEGTFEVSYALTATHDWSEDSRMQTVRSDLLTISGIPRLNELWDELLSLLVDLGNGDNPKNDRPEVANPSLKCWWPSECRKEDAYGPCTARIAGEAC